MSAAFRALTGQLAPLGETRLSSASACLGRRWRCRGACAVAPRDSASAALPSAPSGAAASRLRPRCGWPTGGARWLSQSIRDEGRVTGPRHYPSLSQTLRNTRGRELLRIVDTAVPNLTHIKEFSVVLRALALDGQWRRCLRLMKEMADAGLEVNILTHNQVLAAMAKDKQVDKALAMLHEMRKECIDPDVHSYSSCVGACKPSEWTTALQILEDMPAVALQPDGQCFEHAAAACEEAGEWQRSLELFLEVGRRDLESTSVGHNYALSACRQGKRWRHGFEIMAEMAKRDFEPDFRLKQDLEAQSRGLERAPLPEPSSRTTPSPDNVWQRKQQLRELREQDKRRQEERRLEEERLRREQEQQEKREKREFDKSGKAPEPSTWVVKKGLPEGEGDDMFTLKAGTTLETMRKAAEEHPSCVGFAYWPKERKWFPKRRDSGFTPSTKFRQKHKGETWEWHYIKERAPDEPEGPEVTEEEERRAAAAAAAASRPPRREPQDVPFPRQGGAAPPRRGGEGAPAAGAAGGEEAPRQEAARLIRPRPREAQERQRPPERTKPRPKLRSPGSYVLPVFAQHDRSNHAERQALIKVISRVQEACGAQTDAEFEAECAEVTGTVRLYASHTPCISCMACFCQFQRLFPKVRLCVDFDDWRDTRRMVEMTRREDDLRRKGASAPDYSCRGLSDMSDEEDPITDDEANEPARRAAAGLPDPEPGASTAAAAAAP